MKTFSITLACLLLSSLPLVGVAQTHNQSNESAKSNQGSKQKSNWTPADTARALDKLHQTNLEEIQMGQLAQQNGLSDQVKDLGKTLVDDHKSADNDVKELAQDRKVSLSTTQPSGSTEANNMKSLQGMKGAAFDSKFASMMVQDHDKAIAMARMWRSRTDDKKLHDLLDDVLPKLQKHRDLASKIVNGS
jgi:putative membrane protein